MIMSRKCIKYSLIVCLICVIVYLSKSNIENYTNDHLKKFKAQNKSTPDNDEGGGDVAYLDRHKVECNGLVSQFKLGRNGEKYAYDYKCLQIDNESKLVKQPAKKTTKVEKKTIKSFDLVGKAGSGIGEINCHDPKDPDVGLQSFRYNAAGYYDYTCAKIVKKTSAEIKKEKDAAAKKKKDAEEAKKKKENEINNKKPKAPGCYVYSDDTCPKQKDFNTKGKWTRDVYGETHMGAGHEQKKCAARAANYNDWCGSKDLRTHFVEFSGKRTKEYSHGKGNTVYLDGHNIDCGSSKFIKSLKLTRKGADNYSYLYKCS